MKIRPIQRATGGNDGRVMVVDTLEMKGKSSLAYALKTARGARTIRFAPGLRGIIDLPYALRVPADGGDFTLEWSPDIVLRGAPLTLDSTKNFIIRGLISLPGDGVAGRQFEDRDCLQLLGDCSNGLVENGVFLWGTDENVSIYPTKGSAPHNIEFRYNLVAEALRSAGHPKGEHGYNLLIGSGARDIAIHRNVIMNGLRRNPAIQDCLNVQVFNNVIAGWSQVAARVTRPEKRPTERHVIFASNVFSKLQVEGGVDYPIGLEHIKEPGLKLEIAGNLWLDGRNADSLHAKSNVFPDFALSWDIVSPLCAPFNTQLKDILADVLGNVGVSGDPHRERLLAQIRLGKGGVIDSPSEVGGYAAYE